MQRTFALIIFLIVMTAGLVFFALQSQPVKKPVGSPDKIASQPTHAADTVLTLFPNPVTLTSAAGGTVEVHIDTGYDAVSAVQLEIGYDPKALSNVTITKGNFFQDPLELLNENDKSNGRYSYALGISPAKEPAQGRGTVAVISFQKAPGATGDSTSLTILDKSLVTMLGVQGSVLKQATGTTVILPTRLPNPVNNGNTNASSSGGAQ